MNKKFYVAICALVLLNWTFAPIKINERRVSAGREQFVSGKQSPTNKVPLYFEANQGQLNKRVRFSARGAGYKLFLTAEEAVYVIPERKTKEPRFSKPLSKFPSLEDQKSSRAVAVWMKLVGANQNADAIGVGELAGKHNYFKGSDESKWQSNIPLYQKARFENVYPGVDVEWRGNERGSIEHDFIVSPFASTRQIEWKIEGADKVKVEADGSLLISTPFGELKQNAPITYQEIVGLRSAVESRFEMRGENSVGFAVGEYDRSKPLTIDPATDLNYSTFLGGGTDDYGLGIAAGANNTVYVTGGTNSTTFPTTAGVYDETSNGEYDVFVTKLDEFAQTLIYSTFIGGGADDVGYGIAVDAQGNAYVAGSANFSETTPYPTTMDAPFPNHGGGADAFVTKLNASGSQLVYSTFLGGNGEDRATGIAVNSGRAFVTGYTASGNYPTTPGAFDTTFNGGYDIFVTKLFAQGNALEYSTFIGESRIDFAFGIAVDASGSAFIGGSSEFSLYPTTPGAFDTTPNGFKDAIVTKLNPAGSALVYSTYIGGSGGSVATAIAIDSSGSAYLTGVTYSGLAPFPTTAGAFDTTYEGSSQEIFVTKFNPSGSALAYSTLIGGNNIDNSFGIAVNSAGNVFVTGGTSSAAYPTTAAAFDIAPNGGGDAVLTKLTTSGSALIYSTLIGGSDFEEGRGIALNAAGDVFMTGITFNGAVDFPTTGDVFQPEISGPTDAFVCKFVATPNVPIERAPFDFDGDGKTDISIFRPALGEWWYLKSSNGGNYAAQFGQSTDKLTPGDFSADGRTDIAFWRPSTGEWFVLRSEDSSYYSFPFGTTNDLPAPSDYDGDGKTDAAIFRPSNATWYISKSTGGTFIQQFGANGDIPVAADYDGDGKSDIAIYRVALGQWWIQRSSLGTIAFTFGNSSDKPTQGDFTGDGKSDVAFWRPSTGEWFVLRSENQSYYSFPFGTAGDIPAPGDYDGDAKFDATVFRPSVSTWFINRSGGGTTIQQFGQNGDVPVAGK